MRLRVLLTWWLIVAGAVASANAAVYYKLDKMSFSVNANNLFDKYYFVGGFDYTRAFPGSPRNFMTAIKYTF